MLALRTPLDLVHDLYAAFGRRDLAAIAALVSPDCAIRQTTELPWGGHYHGHEGLREFFARLTGAIDARFTPESVFAAGEQVVAVGHTRGAARASGRAFEIAAVHVWTVADGRATRFEAYIDTPAMRAALG
ncbi:nuclear transport factor 2 family protein [Roseisolibacter sp. H3M3-2]|uniref:nuclear transport factor 2 family protein n=1 Tax=Roseisolibacter sp. H3M3-2 TaxID=3031323 RepID=UPI0023DC2795|nr:nuclear transport factor 2 family protein [Roseisolibacter sp. H3M3-2]MDF1504267.1 nuclear transport factor 2 family protein [Roseisolibacter sp. H3M3-2]